MTGIEKRKKELGNKIQEELLDEVEGQYREFSRNILDFVYDLLQERTEEIIDDSCNHLCKWQDKYNRGKMTYEELEEQCENHCPLLKY